MVMEIPEPVDYQNSEYIDQDIKDFFKEKGGFLSHEIPMMQLIKELQLQRKEKQWGETINNL